MNKKAIQKAVIWEIDKPDIRPPFMELYLGLPTLPPSKAATETLNGEQNGG